MDDFSYPLPVTVICALLGVPEADEPRFQAWATQLATAIEPDARHDEAGRHRTVAAFDEISAYMRDLIQQEVAAPGRRHAERPCRPGLRRRQGGWATST